MHTWFFPSLSFFISAFIVCFNIGTYYVPWENLATYERGKYLKSHSFQHYFCYLMWGKKCYFRNKLILYFRSMCHGNLYLIWQQMPSTDGTGLDTLVSFWLMIFVLFSVVLFLQPISQGPGSRLSLIRELLSHFKSPCPAWSVYGCNSNLFAVDVMCPEKWLAHEQDSKLGLRGFKDI